MVTDHLVKDSVQPPQNNNEDVVISVEGVSKKFCRDLKKSLWYGTRDMAGEILGGSQEGQDLRPSEFWALKDVSLQLRKGEALGLVGPNGSGKTTLLRMIAGLIKPDSGKITINGRIAPLLAAGVGFNPILTGRENVYANMSILGLSKQEIDDRFDEVVEFAEIPHAIEAPVQSYSSGMRARLGFACAIHVEPEILLLDEVLAVGDTKFRAKCLNRLYKLRQDGVSFVMVSHNSNMLATASEKGLYLSQGKLLLESDIMAVIHKYEEDLFLGKDGINELGYWKRSSQNNIVNFQITEIFFRDEKGNVVETPYCGEYISLCLVCQVTKVLKDVSFVLKCEELEGQSATLFHIQSLDKNITLEFDKPGKYELQVQMPCFGLEVGTYAMQIAFSQDTLYRLDKIENFKFSVKRTQPKSYRAKFYQPFKVTIL